MKPLTLLEDFARIPEPEPAGPPPAWYEGHAAGLREGRAQALAETAALDAETAQALSDLSFTVVAAQQLFLGQLRPLLTLVAHKIVPDILHATLGAALAQEMILAAETDLQARLELRLPPVDCARVGAIAADVAGCAVTVVPDPRLLPGQAVLTAPAGETAFDIARFAADVTDALDALHAEPPRRTAHG